MKTEILKISDLSADSDKIRYAAEIIKRGGLVAFPTETVYGLGADATDELASKKIYSAKGRPSDNPLIIHVSNPEDAEKYAYTDKLYCKLAKAFMPGPLTVIMPRRDTIPLSVTGGLETVAVRCPSHPVANALIRESGTAIAAPSANISGSPSPTRAEHVIRDMDSRIDAIIDGGSCDIGVESTIVKLDGDRVTLLRPGGVTLEQLSGIFGSVEVAPAVTGELAPGERPLSPGMKYRHYAPCCPLVLLEGSEDCVLRFMRHAQNAEKCAVICYDEEADLLRNERLIPFGSKDDPAAQAENLFDALRRADATDADIIYAHLPATKGIGLALYNRMIRAAAHTVKKV